MYTIDQIAEILGRSESTVRYDMWRGVLKACGKKSRKYLISEQALQDYMLEIGYQNTEIIEITIGLLDVIDKVIGEERMDAITDTAIELFQEAMEKEIKKLIKD